MLFSIWYLETIDPLSPILFHFSDGDIYTFSIMTKSMICSRYVITATNKYHYVAVSGVTCQLEYRSVCILLTRCRISMTDFPDIYMYIMNFISIQVLCYRNILAKWFRCVTSYFLSYICSYQTVLIAPFNRKSQEICLLVHTLVVACLILKIKE